MEKNSQTLATALLIMDIQPLTMQMLGESAAPLVSSLQQAISAARATSIPVIYVVVGFRKGFPEIGTGGYNKSFAALRQGATMPGLENPEVDPVVAPQPALTRDRSSLAVVLIGEAH